MVIQKKQLLEALKLAMPGIESGSAVLQGADSFIFHNGKIYSYNDTISVTVPIESAGLIGEDLEGAVKADEFFKIISKLPSDEIDFSVTEKNTWLLKCGKSKAEMTLMSFDSTSRLESITPSDDWIDIDEDFIAGLITCKMANNKTQLSGIYVGGKEVYSTDSYQMNKYEMKKELPTFWVSDNTVNELLKIKNFTKMQLQDTWAHFMTDNNVIFSIKTLQADKFPASKIRTVLKTSQPKENDIHSKFPNELFNAIDRADAFSIDIFDHSAVRLTLNKDNIEVSSERNSGKYSENVNWDEPIEIENPLVIYVDSTMMQFVATRSLEFYLMSGPERNGKPSYRLLFVTESSVHLLVTLDGDKE